MFIGLRKIKEKILGYLLPTLTKYTFSLKLNQGTFNIFIDTKCLVMSPRPGDETYAMGGFMAKHPKNFEVLTLTDGSKGVPEKDKIDARFIMRKEFNAVMEMLRVRGHKFFDIEEGKLIQNYHTFSKIDISEIDYIFVPNIFEENLDSKAILLHLKKLISEKEHKETLKIVFYELYCPISLPNYTVDITLTQTLKQDMMDLYVSRRTNNPHPDVVLSLNKYRSKTEGGYNESFMVMDISTFNTLVEQINPKEILIRSV